MITFEFQDLEDLRERLANPKMNSLERASGSINEGEQWKKSVGMGDAHKMWQVYFGRISLTNPIDIVEVIFSSNGRFYSGEARIYSRQSKDLTLPERIEGYNIDGDPKSKMVVFDEGVMFGLRLSGYNGYLNFGSDGSKRRKVPDKLDDEFSTDLNNFAGLLGAVVSENCPNRNIKYFLNPK